MKIGRCELRPRAAEDESAMEPHGVYMARLDELAGILAGIPWILAGGCALAATRGTFHRRHLDVDVAFEVQHFPRIDAALRRAGYYLETSFNFGLLGAWRGSLHVPLAADSWLLRRRMRKLKYKDRTGRLPDNHLLGAIDPFPFRIDNGYWITCDGRNRCLMKRPLVGHCLRTASGREVACLDLAYVAYFKLMLPHPKHAADLALIGQLDQGTSALAGASEMLAARTSSQPA